MTNGVCAIGVMAKAPQAGRSKTRLCPPLTHEQAAAMSAAFLRDITENIAAAARSAPIQGLIAFAPLGAEALFDGHLADGTRLIPAIGHDAMPENVQGFGRCLLDATERMIADGYSAACVLNSDSPTLPTQILVETALRLLAPGERVVLGPAEDGGYYLLGMQRVHAHLFADITWSTDTVAEATRERARELGLELVELPTWYDVDDHAALLRLLAETGGARQTGSLMPNPAPATTAALDRLGLRRLASQAAE